MLRRIFSSRHPYYTDALLLSFAIAPVVVGVWTSLSKAIPDGGVGVFGSTESWRTIFHLGLWHSWILSLEISVVAAGLTAQLASLTIRRIRLLSARTRRMIFGAMLVPMLVSLVARAFAIMSIVQHLRPLGFGYNLPTVAVGLVYVYFPYAFVFFWGESEEIPDTIIVASRDLGASPLDIEKHIIAPMLRSARNAAFMMLIILMSIDYVVPNLFGGAKFVLIGQAVDFLFFRLRDWPAAAAMAIGSIIISGTCAISLYLLASRIAKAWHPK